MDDPLTIQAVDPNPPIEILINEDGTIDLIEESNEPIDLLVDEIDPTGIVTSVNGQTGDVTLDADDIAATASRIWFTTAEQSKLSGIEAGATADQTPAEIAAAYASVVGQVSAGEITAGTETALRTYSPADIVAFVAEHGLANPVDYIDFATGQPDPTYQKGRVFWDDTHNCPAYFDDITGTSVQIAYEALDRGFNNIGSQIDNFDVVYFKTTVTGGWFEIGLSEADALGAGVKSRAVVGLATHDIPNTTSGKIVSRGRAGGDTTAWEVGDELWMPETPGQPTNVKPLLPSSQVRIGKVLVKDATDGIIQIKVEDLSWLGVATAAYQSNERTGFKLISGRAVDASGTAVTVSVDDSTRTFTIGSVSGSFPVYSVCNQFIKTGDQDVEWTDVEGDHFFYFDIDGTLTHSTSFLDAYILGPQAIAGYSYWDATNKETILDSALYECHGMQMDGADHYHWHTNIGAKTKSGLALNTLNTTGDGSVDSHAQFGIDSGVISDEDLWHPLSSVASTAGTRILYLEGATPVLRQTTNAGYSVIMDSQLGGSVDRLVWNELVGSTWQTTPLNVNKYVLCHTFAIGTGTGGEDFYSVIGQAEYGNAGDAEDGALVELGTISGLLPFEEVRPISTTIFQSGSYGNAVNARLRPPDEGQYVDWRDDTVPGGSGFTPTDHQTLSNRDVYGAHTGMSIQYAGATTLTLASDAITYAQPTHIVAAQTGTTDDLSTITVGTTDAYRLTLWADTGDTITIKHGVGNIVTNDANDFEITGDKMAKLTFNGSVWVVTNVGGGGGGSGDVSAAANLDDNTIIKGDGGSKGVQDSGITLDDSNNLSGIGNIVLTGVVDGRDVATDGSKLDGIEAGADVTDTTNVNAAGAVMTTDTDLSTYSWFLDEDDMASNSAVKTISQQSMKTYVDGLNIANGTNVIASHTVSTAEQSKTLSFTGVEKCLVYISSVNDDASTAVYSLFINGDTTPGNYHNNKFSSNNGANPTGAEAANSAQESVSTTDPIVISADITTGPVAPMIEVGYGRRGASDAILQGTQWITYNGSNPSTITSVTVSTDQSDGLGAGTKIWVVNPFLAGGTSGNLMNPAKYTADGTETVANNTPTDFDPTDLEFDDDGVIVSGIFTAPHDGYYAPDWMVEYVADTGWQVQEWALAQLELNTGSGFATEGARSYFEMCSSDNAGSTYAPASYGNGTKVYMETGDQLKLVFRHTQDTTQTIRSGSYFIVTEVPTSLTVAGGDVAGAASSTDNALARYDSTTGKVLQNGKTIEDDDGNVHFHGTTNASVSGAGEVEIGNGQVEVGKGLKINGAGSDTVAFSPYLNWNIAGSGRHIVQMDASNDLRFWGFNLSAWQTLMKINNTGGVEIDNGDLNFTSTQGITFDSGDKLDDYDEGTWTPAEANVTLDSALGVYTKIGNVCHIGGYLDWPSTADANNIVISGLPFTVGSSDAARGGISVGGTDYGSFFQMLLTDSATTIFFYDPSLTRLTNANMSTKRIWFGGSYEVA